jgi:glycerol-3-phosphate acyltransferase PlsY
MKIAVLLAIAYVLGSINFSILLFRLLGKDDPRNQFSGNAGTTNVYRQAGLFWAAVIFLLDLGRALALSGAALFFLELDVVPWVGFALVAGNRFPCFHQFRGGKGVAGYLGFTILISPLYSGLSALVWVMAYAIVRIPFVASLFMVATLTIGIIISCNGQLVATTGAITTALFIIFNHRQNILALRAGS